MSYNSHSSDVNPETRLKKMNRIEGSLVCIAKRERERKCTTREGWGRANEDAHKDVHKSYMLKCMFRKNGKNSERNILLIYFHISIPPVL